jgi:ankyrin repeat protein
LILSVLGCRSTDTGRKKTPASLETFQLSTPDTRLDLRITRPPQAVHYPSQALRFEVTVTNRGPGDVVVPLNQQGFEVGVNGRWYHWEHSDSIVVPDKKRYSPLSKGQSHPVEIALSGTGYPNAGRWYEKGDFKTLGYLPRPLRFKPGREYSILITLPPEQRTRHQALVRTSSSQLHVRIADGTDYFEEFMKAVECGDNQSVTELLAKHPHFAQARGFWKIPLNTAIIEDHLEVALILLHSGANPNMQDVLSGYTALHHAVRSSRVEMVDVLLAHGADPGIRNYLKFTPFGLAILRSNDEAAQKLMPDDAGSRLWAQIAVGNLEAVRRILDQQPELVQSHLEGAATPLHLAVRKGHIEIAKLLLSSNADVNARDFRGWTPLMLAAYYNHLDCAELLLVNGAKRDIKTLHTDITALDYAKRCGHEQMIALLTPKIQ